jgi:hypothetical protein
MHFIGLCHDLKRCRTTEPAGQRPLELQQNRVTDMYQVRNNRRLSKLLLAHVCARPAMIIDLCDAMAFVDMHGDQTRPWVTAETAIRCADHNPRLIDMATKTLENVLLREGMLD